MRRSSYFWGFILVLVGILFLLTNLGYLEGINLWNLIWPLSLVALGLWTLWGVFFNRPTGGEQAAIPLEGAKRAQVRINHGAGKLAIQAGNANNDLLLGTFVGGLISRTRREGDLLEARLSIPPRVSPFWFPMTGLNWSFNLNREILLALDFQTGANEARIDLTDLHVTDLRFHSGASSSEIYLPASAGTTRVELEIGAASVNIHIPEGVAARVRARGGLSSTNINRKRFPRTGDYFQSPDYDTAQNKAEIRVDVGVGTVTIN